MLIRRVGRLSVESADDYEESADGYIPTGASVLESAYSALEPASSIADPKGPYPLGDFGVTVPPIVLQITLWVCPIYWATGRPIARWPESLGDWGLPTYIKHV